MSQPTTEFFEKGETVQCTDDNSRGGFVPSQDRWFQ